MITEHQLDIQSASIIELYQRLEDDLFKMFIDRLTAKGAYALKSDTILQWQLERLNDLHLVNQDTIKLIAQTTNIAQPLLTKLILDNGLDVAKQVTKQLDVSEPKYNLTNQLLHGILDQTMEDLNNNVNETLITTNYGEGEATKIYRQIVTDTTAQVITGLKTPEKALADTIYKWVDNGIKTSLTTKNGANWGLEGYTRTVITSTTFRTYNEVTMTTANENDCYTFVMTTHPAARPACAYIQGRIVTNLTATQAQSKGISYPSIYDHGYGEPAGTLGINCRHRLIPYIKGVNTNTMTPPDPSTAVDNHKTMQQQRALERRVRLYKRKKMLADQLGDKSGSQHWQQLVQDNQARLRDIVKNNKFLYRDYAREKSFGPSDRETKALKARSAVNVEKQNRHIVGTKEYEQYEKNRYNKGSKYPPSILNITSEEAQALIKKSGNIGSTQSYEYLDAGNHIATFIDQKTGEKIPTSIVRVAYSKNGAHLTPADPRKKRGGDSNGK